MILVEPLPIYLINRILYERGFENKRYLNNPLPRLLIVFGQQ